MDAKKQAYHQHMRPLIDRLYKLAEQHKINFSVVVDIATDEGCSLLTSGLVDPENNGPSVYALACITLTEAPPEVVAAATDAVSMALVKIEAAAHPHGIAH